MDAIVIAVSSVTIIGVVCAAVISIAAKLMAVKTDERVACIEKYLPGTNCGACGYPGCAGYAAALVADAGVNNALCTPGGAKVIEELIHILGVEAGKAEGKIAVVHCRGDSTVHHKKMDYEGIKTCVAAKALFGGEGACSFGCLGYGDCQTACPSDAVCMENGLARVHRSLCTGCGLCVKACPSRLITVEDSSISTAVLCANLEKGAVVRKKCVNACLGCRKCVRECPSGALIVEDCLAGTDYEKCTGCGHCVQTCVTHCIQPV